MSEYSLEPYKALNLFIQNVMIQMSQAKINTSPNHELLASVCYEGEDDRAGGR